MSHEWLSADHPDPKGEQLRVVGLHLLGVGLGLGFRGGLTILPLGACSVCSH